MDRGGVGAGLWSDPLDNGPSFVARLRASGELKVPNCGKTAIDAVDSTGLEANPLDCLSTTEFFLD